VGLQSHRTSLTVADDPRELLIDAIERHGGRLARVAWDLGVDRRKLYDKVESWGLWPTVNHARERRREERLRKKSQCRTT
jgi:DNA-binding NtrC family response regulator